MESTDNRADGPEFDPKKGSIASKYWNMSRREAAERFDLPYLVEDEEPDASAGWREEYAHQGVVARGRE